MTTVLVMDSPEWAKYHAGELAAAGHTVLPASTVEEARQLYRVRWRQIGAVIVDERLFDVSFVKEAKETARVVVATSDDEHRRRMMVSAGCTNDAAKEDVALRVAFLLLDC